jgi:hypothetical protein
LACQLPPGGAAGIVGIMAAHRSKEITPDLFSTPTAIRTPASRAPSEAKTDQPSPPRHFLPKDLAGSLRRLDDAEIDSLLAAVTDEAQRRKRLPATPTRDKVRGSATPQPRRAVAEDSALSLTKGQLNAVRAAFKAGVKPSAIARQFGISQAVVRKAIASEA